MTFSTTEYDTLAVLRYALNPEQPAPELRTPWAEIEKELEAQTVKFVTADVAERFIGDDGEKLRFTMDCAGNMRTFYEILEEQDRLAGILGDIPFAVLKGTAAAVYYPRPELRQMGDIDILVGPEQFDSASAALEQAGYKKGLSDYRRHVAFDASSGIHIELHRWFSSSDSKEQNAVLDGSLYDGLERRECKELCGYRVSLLPALENGLVLLGHINQHISSGLGLRQIVDWMQYVRAELDDAAWKGGFAAAAESIGMKTLAEVTTRMCKQYLGLTGVTWCDGAEEDLAEGLMEYILNKGNFGRKKERGSRDTVSVMHHFRNPVSAFRYLHAGGMTHWEAAKKHKILRPFAWMYQIGHILRKGLKRKVKMSKFLGEAKQSRYETDLLTRLKITRT